MLFSPCNVNTVARKQLINILQCRMCPGCIHKFAFQCSKYGTISNNMSVLKFNKVLSIFRTNLRMMSINTTKKFEGKVAVVTASTDG